MSDQHEFRCRQCGDWVSTAPAPWVRGRCVNRSCSLFRKQQTMYAERPPAPAVTPIVEMAPVR